ncbi:hypothetical protein [Mycolicibacterium neoaurum]|uniref:hypothetical protein n=1 Tax=Mycolicibacterium neoaurum TaxID=1795 RepID=UPI001F4CE0E7|nr:hypothetical protein [Mycolicibacterium neoaurum]
MTDPHLLDATAIQTNPILMLALGAAGILAAITLLRFLRRVKRMIWTAALLAAAGGAGTGGSLAFLDAVTTLRY